MVILDRKFANLVIAVLLALLATGCASKSQYFDSPGESISANDRNLFSKALKEQGKGRYEAAGKLWEAFLKEHPNSFEAHNNFGMTYFMNDEVSESITEFEAAHKWAPFSERIRANLSRSYQVQVAVMRENREFYVAIRHLKQLSAISTSMDKEKVLFMIEEVDHELFESLKKLNTAAGYKEYFKNYPQGPNAREAKRRMEELQKSSNETSPAEMQGVLTGNGKGGSALDKTNMVKAAELEDITEEVLAAGKAPMKEKSLPLMAQGGDALPLEDEEPESPHPETAMNTESNSARNRLLMETETPDPEDPATRKLISELQAIAQESTAGQDDLAPETAASAVEPEPLDLKTILEMQALANESGSKQTGLTPETEAVPEAPAPAPEPVAVESAPLEEAAGIEAPAPAMVAENLAAVQETNGMQGGVAPETAPIVEAPAPAVEEEAPLPEAAIENAANEEMAEPPQAETIEARLPETVPETPPTVAMAEDVRSASVPIKVIVNVRSFLKVRSKPSLSGMVVGRLKNNDVRIMVEEVEGWYKVEHIDGRTGWISQRFSRKIHEGSEIMNMTTDNFKVVSYL